MGQAAFASASGVSALLGAATDETVAALRQQLQAVLAPYRGQVVSAAPSRLVVDFDLTSLAVSDQAATYEGAEFGSMSAADGPGKGYQFARAQLQSPSGSYVLGGFLHPGKTVSVHCLHELVVLVEADLEAGLAERQRGSSAARRRCKRLEDRCAAKRDEISALQARHDACAAENAANPAPRRILLRLDGGFGDAAHLAELYEQGYDFVARPHNYRVGESLREEPELHWEKVSKNGFLAESGRTTLGKSPYPVRLFACRQWRGEGKPERWSALVTNPELTAAEWPVRRVGTFYNGHQAIEAGIKESKGVFASRHLPTRHRAGIAVYQELVLLAQNLVRWFRRLLGHPRLAAAGIKELVRIGANSRAVILHQAQASLLQFAADGPWRGLRLPLGPLAFHQFWFSFLEDPALGGGGP